MCGHSFVMYMMQQYPTHKLIHIFPQSIPMLPDPGDIWDYIAQFIFLCKVCNHLLLLNRTFYDYCLDKAYLVWHHRIIRLRIKEYENSKHRRQRMRTQSKAQIYRRFVLSVAHYVGAYMWLVHIPSRTIFY